MQNGALIFVHDPETKNCKDATIYQQLFNLTRAESNLAAELANGLSVEEAEEALHISHNTTRAHLRSIFSKTGVSSRADLIRLLINGVAPLAGEESETRH
jgi:DNA-binding CsgD family transcriptional regulator